MKLINKVKPEVLESLKDDNEIKYSSSYKAIIFSLSDVENYRDLSIKDLQTLICFLRDEFKPKSDIEMFYGDLILKEKHKL